MQQRQRTIGGGVEPEGSAGRRTSGLSREALRQMVSVHPRHLFRVGQA